MINFRPVKVALDGQALVGGAPTGFGIYAQLVAAALEDIARADFSFKYHIVYPEPRDKPLAAVWQRMLWEQIRLTMQLSKARPDLLHSPCLGAPIFPPVKLVCTIHDLISYNEPPASFFAQRYFVEMTPAGWRKAVLLITDTETVKQEVQELLRIPRSRIVSIPLYSRFEGKAAAQRTPPSRPTFLLAGTMEPRKGYATAIGALAKLPGSLRADARLLISGKRTPHTTELMLLAQQLGVAANIEIAGYSESLETLYLRATALVFPSTAEGFGLPPLEAMSLGVPALISDIPVLREVYGEAQGIANPGMFPLGDEDALAELMRMCIEEATFNEKLASFSAAAAQTYSRARFAQGLRAAYDLAVRS